MRKAYRLLLILCILFSQTVIGQKIKHINTSNGLSNNTVISILQDSKGFFWFGTDDGLNKFDGFTFTIYKPDLFSINSISHSIAKVLFEDSHGNIWIGTDGGGLNKYDAETETFVTFYNNPKDPSSLSHNNVSAIAEDKNHNIWVGTYGGGLNRFDAATNKFIRFVNEADKAGSLSSNYINCIYVDHSNTLWIGTWGRGLNYYDEKNKQFVNFTNIPENPNSISNSTVNCIFEDKKQRLWMGTWDGGLNLFLPATKTFEHFQFQNGNPHSLSNNIVRSVCEDNSGKLWIATFGGGINQFDYEKKEFTSFKNKADDPNSLSSNNVWTITFANNEIWVGTINGGINRLSLQPEKFHILPINSSNQTRKNTDAKAIIKTSSGYAFGTENDGLFLLNKEFKTLQNIQCQPGKPNTLLSNVINALLEDKYGDIWIATQDGLSRYSPSTKQLRSYRQTPNTFKCLSFNAITHIFEDQLGTIWVSTWGGGLNRYNRETDDFDYYINAKKSKVTFLVDMTGKIVSKDGIHIAGSMNGWNPGSDRLSQVKGNIYGISLNLYPSHYEYKFLNGKSWGTEEIVPKTCATNNNREAFTGNQDVMLDAVLFGKGCNKVANEPLAIEEETENCVLSSNHVYCAFEDREGTLWVGTNNGLNRYNRQSDRFSKLSNSRGDTTSLSDNHVSCIFEDKAGRLWLGTLGGGLNLLNRKTNTFKSYRENKGLANNNIRAISEDSQANIWLSTNIGITRFNPKTETFRNFDKMEGLDETTFHSGALLKDYTGYFYVGSTGGLVCFNPNQLLEDTVPPKVFITDLYLSNEKVPVGQMNNGKTILQKSLQNTELLELSYKDNIITFRFTAVHYAAPEKNLYAYKLEGFDSKWHYTNASNRMATYTNLNGGNYTFLVKASNSDGIWNEKPASLRIYISPPFWKSAWFIILVIFISMALIYFWYQKRIHYLHKKLIQEQILNEKKIVEMEKFQLQSEVERKNTELGAVAMQMVNKSKFISDQLFRLNAIKKNAEPATKEKLNKLIGKLNNDMALNQDWEYFELHFDNVYQDFIRNIKTDYPEMPSADIRMAAYIRMGLSNKEISELMNITLRGIESRRYRLRKAFNLKQGDNLSDFIFKL